MKKTTIILCCISGLFIMGNVHAENIVSDYASSNSFGTVVSNKDIEARHVSDIYDLLRSVPGIDVVQKGGAGQETLIYIRGAESVHTLVLIDGVRLNSLTRGGFDFADIPADNIEHIEIIRGPLSALYGADAVGGVIRIFSKKARMSSGTAGFEAGSYSTTKETVSTEVKQDNHDITLSVSRVDSEGFSAVTAGSERDGYQNTAVSSYFGITRSATSSLDLSAHLTESKTKLDGINKDDDPNYQQQRRRIVLGMSRTSSVTNNWVHALSLSITNDRLVHIDEDTPLNRDQFDSGIQTINWQHNIRDEEGNYLTLGYEWQREKGEKKGVFSKFISNNALYLQEQRGIGTQAQLLTGFRWDDNSAYGSVLTYRFGVSYIQEEGVRWHVQYGTGFSGPKMDDLFLSEDTSSVGNPELVPEKSEGWEVGIEQAVSDSLSMSVNYFKNNFKDIIVPVLTSTGKKQPQNLADGNSHGIETDLTWNLSQMIHLEGNYTYDDTEDKETHFYLQRRPLNKYTATFHINPSGRGRMAVNLIHVGKRVEWADTDFDGRPDQVNTLSAYSKVDLLGSYSISKTVEIFGRIENLFDKKYEEAKGYNTAGFSTYGGLKMSF